MTLISDLVASLEARSAAEELERAIGFTVVSVDLEFPGEHAATTLLGFWRDPLDAMRFGVEHLRESVTEFGPDKVDVRVQAVMPAQGAQGPPAAPFDWEKGDAL